MTMTKTAIMTMNFEHDHDQDQHEQRQVHTLESEVEELVCRKSRGEPRQHRGSISSAGININDEHCNEKYNYEEGFQESEHT